jgi:hypothetical protein
MYIAQNVCIIVKWNFDLIATTTGKPTYIVCIIDVYMYTFLCQQSLLFFPMYKRVIQEQVFIFRRLKINHESHEFIGCLKSNVTFLNHL